MADYPNYTQLIGTRRVALDGTVMERSVSGKPRFRTYYPQIRYEFIVEHELDGPDKDILAAHFEDHRTLVFSFLFRGDGQTYSVQYMGAPTEATIPGNDRWRVTNRLAVV